MTYSASIRWGHYANFLIKKAISILFCLFFYIYVYMFIWVSFFVGLCNVHSAVYAQLVATFNVPLQSGGRYWKTCPLSTFALAPRFCWVSFSPQRHIIKILFFKFVHIKSRFFKRINDYPGSFFPNNFYSSIHFFFLFAMCQGRGQRASSSRVLLALAWKADTKIHDAYITVLYYSPLFLEFKRRDLLNFCPGYSHKH